MSKTISKRDTSLKALNRLIEGRFYKGYITPEKFELTKNSFPNNYKLIGTSNQNKKYKLSVEHKYPLNIAYKIFLFSCVLISLVFLVRKNWIASCIFLTIFLVIYMTFKIKSKKEINQFLDKYLALYKIEEYK